ncbi:MAG TPA: saccharopine dehydrogenase NADP-binding domain-containing protein [Streptomyces sp.]|nr:saccharopine dehydrogenase NADP-binding domain-containing protein [Streptomyces sp.]
MTEPLIAIYGATGHTGRLVAAELLSRERPVLLAGRSSEALEALAADLGRPGLVRTHTAPLDDPKALRSLAESAAALIHCAGPYAETGAPVAQAAAEAGCHYLDHAVEPHPVKHLFDSLDEPARRSGAVLIPSMSFYGGLADLLASVVTAGMPAVDRVTVGYAVTGWRMTPGARRTAELLIGEIDRVTFTGGEQRVGPAEIRNTVFPFPPPLGPRTMIAPFPSCEVVTIPRHIAARAVESQLTSSTFEEEQVFTSEGASAQERAATEFTVAVQATAVGGGGRNGQVSGSDIWRTGALASVVAALRLTGGEAPARTGVLAPAEAVPAAAFLAELERLGACTVAGTPGGPS